MAANDPIDLKELKRLLPHRYPFLLVDRILEVVVGERIRGLKNVTVNEEFFQGHFPQMPVMPGVLILEALAQVCGVLAAKTTNTGPYEGTILLFAGIDKARFRRQVVPGDQLILEAELTRHKRDILKFTARALVDGEVATQADMMCAVARLNEDA